MHLADVGMTELPGLEVNDQKTPEPPMEKQQVNTEPRIVQPQSPLAADVGKIVTQLQEEVRQMTNQRIFKICLGIVVLEVEKLQHEWILDGFFRGKRIARFRVLPAF